MLIHTLKKILVLLLLFVTFGCSNSKDTFISRRYHNLSAHYNGYYNARLKIGDGVEKLAEQHVDKYDRILNVYQYADATKAKTAYPMMDEAIKKTTTVISRHTIIDKNGNEKPESEKWIDDNWLEYGKAQFYKHEYFTAIEAFEYIERAYKKESSRFAASLWLAKTYIELTQLNEAEEKLDFLRNQKDLPKNLRSDLEAVWADFYLQTKNYDKGAEHLQKAIALTKKRTERVRWTFILAQIQQKNNKNKEAYELYSKVIKMNPKYEMSFVSKINRSRCYYPGMNKKIDVRQELLKMEVDAKNQEFLDQIYYALAGIDMQEEKKESAIGYYNKSVAASTSNTNQKALSYLELAKIYFLEPQYRKAQSYYDSTIAILSDDYPDYSEILNKRNSLTKLIKNLNTISREDSLLTLSGKSQAEKEKVINDAIDAEIKALEEKKKLQEELNKEQNVNQIFSDPRNNPIKNTVGDSWYFYNPATMSLGLNDFTRKWGSNRKLEDNWRRSNKEQTITAGGDDEVKSDDKKESADLMSPEARKEKAENLLKTIPSTQEQIDKSTNKIIEAYYSAGMIYSEQIGDKAEAAKMLEALLEKYPENKYKLPAYYHLYKSYLALKNQNKSDYYKNILLTKYGDSEYAEIIRNPNRGAELANQKSKLDVFYEETYKRFLNGDYASVISRKSEADKSFIENPYKAKFDYLKALSIGRTQPRNTFVASLQDVIRTYPDDPVKDEAQNILDLMNDKNMSYTASVDTVKRLYNYIADTTHFVIIYYQNVTQLSSETFKIRLSDYNNKYFSNSNLNVSAVPIDHLSTAILIKNFDNKARAEAYSNGVYDSDEVFGNTNPDLYEQFIISINNYPSMLRTKDVKGYMDFFYTFYK